ncbi:CCA tRNA nucleotidyltransferase [Mesorhizobium sp. NBSH29]|uniref:CCA tRNA nucleotidyltransferase n=1 Tax=Mesorhizobium sp. NBSH29 TaxID=2654249 RepID=UPI0018967EE9|nr:CCA tRNA nucleotidyltransferase [Mesorhizobium sp. NBSH29]QPC85313.1 CCA tRNA nucleotidyltransferase [Mesorhizobium sp. NBSH29]
MNGVRSVAAASWLKGESLQSLLAVLSASGEESRIAGGAVRNTLLNEPVTDIDIATTNRPEETVRRAEAAGFKAVPTGAEHGTITVVAKGQAFEVTTLRSDIDTDGRHAKVVFGRDWLRDAERRDFTINALYANADGTVVDLVGGLADLESRTLRFIGDAETRIREDNLRILRFFRFFAWYGSGRPDAAGLKACARLKDGLDQLSAERVWNELKRLLAAPDPSRALLWMRQAGVLSKVLPESEKWGIDSIHALVKAERDLSWHVDPLLRLEAIVPPDAARMKTLAERLKLSKSDAQRLRGWSITAPLAKETSDVALSQALYRGDPLGVADRLRLHLIAARERAEAGDKSLMEAGSYIRQLRFVQEWQRPEFPIRGSDLTDLGMKQGAALGHTLKRLETLWIDSGFVLERDALMARAAEISQV